jgi:hypothetical protein
MTTTNASSWNNGKPNYQRGTGLGLRIDTAYQPTIFSGQFTTIDIYHNNSLIAGNVNVSNKACHELISVDIGLWLINNNLHQWPVNKPHRFTITHQPNTNKFDIT